MITMISLFETNSISVILIETKKNLIQIRFVLSNNIYIRSSINVCMVLISCPKCGESYSASPPDPAHKKLAKYPDRDTFPYTIECKMCGNVITIYWKPTE